LFKSVANIDLTHVPYRGSSAQAITALITGDVSMFMVGTSTEIGQVQAGTLRGLAVTAPHRMGRTVHVSSVTPHPAHFVRRPLPMGEVNGVRCSV
jgi:tripartite-type tricarboxylate transporter receptor subunit TctC